MSTLLPTLAHHDAHDAIARRRLLAAVAVLILLLASAVALHAKLDRIKRSKPIAENMLYLPSGAYLHQIALGYDQAWADILWLRTISYYADQITVEGEFKYLSRMLDIITTLDPKFLYPYLFGGVTLALQLHRPDLANNLLKKAMRYHPDVWRVPFLIGFNAYFMEGNAAVAARYIDQASRLPGAPSYLSSFAARLYVKGNGRAKALQFLGELIQQTEDPTLRAQLIKRYKEIQEGRVRGPYELPRRKDKP
jgi:tetratricopeptide (TPR) repeat protein